MEFVASNILTSGVYDVKVREKYKSFTSLEMRAFLYQQIHKGKSDLLSTDRMKEFKLPEGWLDHPMDHLNGFISTKVGLFQHFLMFDCDSLESMRSLMEDMANENVPYYVYRSSLKKYWMFCDKLCTAPSRVMPHVEDYIINAGADERHALLSSKRGRFLVRAYPRCGYIPEFEVQHKAEQFSKKFRQWTNDFDKYWKSAGMKDMLSDIVVASL